MASVRRKGPGRWEARWYVTPITGGKAERRSKIVRATTEAEALRLAHRAEAEARDAGTADPRHTPTVDTALDRHLEAAKVRLTERSWRSMEIVMRRHVRPPLGRIPLARLTTADIEQMMTGMHNAGLSTQTILHALVALTSALRSAQRAGLIARNPAELVEKPRVRRREVRVAAVDDLFGVLDWCDQQGRRTADELAMAIRLAAVTGARLGEVCGLRWSDFDKPNRTVRVRRAVTDYAGPNGRIVEVKDTKTPVVGSISALPEQMIERLDQFYAGREIVSPWLFPGGDGSHPIATTAMNTRFGRAVVKSGVTPFAFHALRHLFATRSIEAGIPVPVVAALLRHSRASTTSDIYWHASHGAAQIERRGADEAARQLGPGL